MPRKAQPYGGLPRYHVKRIRAYLEYLRGAADGKDAYTRQRVARGALVLSGALLDKYADDLQAWHYASMPPHIKRIEDRHSAEREKILARRPPSRVKEQHERHIHDLLIKYGDFLNEPPKPISSFRQYSKAVLKPVPELTKEQQEQSQQFAALAVWCGLVLGKDKAARTRLDALGFDKYTLPALKAGLKVLKRKRKGRLMDFDPHQSFAAIGIITEAPNAPEAATPSAAHP